MNSLWPAWSQRRLEAEEDARVIGREAPIRELLGHMPKPREPDPGERS